MTSNTNINQSKDQLIDEMMALATDSNIYTVLQQTLKQILQSKTLFPYLYLHKKMSLRSKFDNTKISQYVCQLAVYLASINPLMLQKQSITSKIMSLCIDKFNHLKIKKFEANQFINFLLVDLGEKDKAGFIKNINQQKMDNDNLPVIVFANIMYWTIVYLFAIRQINELNNKLKTWGVGGGNNNAGENLIGYEVMNEYLEKVDQEDSVLKMLDFGQLSEGQNVLEKVLSKIFELFDGMEVKESSKNI